MKWTRSRQTISSSTVHTVRHSSNPGGADEGVSTSHALGRGTLSTRRPCLCAALLTARPPLEAMACYFEARAD